MADQLTPRARARQENLARIRALALTQLAESGPEGLSLREIAKEMGLVSSGIYRYYDSRDALLTDLIADAYAQLAEALSRARGTKQAMRSVRAWAVEQPHRYQLIYGTPVVGYAAPEITVGPAAAVLAAFVAACTDVSPVERLPRGMAGQVDAVRRELGDQRPREAMVGALLAFAQTLGIVSLELGGHLVGTFEDGALLLDAAAAHAVS